MNHLSKSEQPLGLMILWTLDVAAGEPRLLPQRFRQNRAWIELKKIWRTKKNVKGFSIKKIKGGYSVAIAGFITFLPFKKALHKKRIANDRFTIDSIKPTRRDIVIIVTSGLPCQL
uniref:Ribosomal protein S1 n=1 Tax=Hordeum vulgare subsp. vulgare TaxID=112509 RepID=A0A8I6WV11_HORVV